MRIAFVLPAPVRVPGGGPRVVMRHAAGLARRGHDVRVVAPRWIPGEESLARAAAVSAWNWLQGTRTDRTDDATSIGVHTVGRLRAEDLDDDAVIATGIQTVYIVNRTGNRAWWFMQGDETFVRSDAPDAWGLPLRKVVCSRWLADAVRLAGHRVEGVVPNAVDPGAFALDRPPEAREESVLALYHRHPVKGPETLLSTYARLRESRPGARLTLFAARSPSHRVPRGVDVVVRPDPGRLRRLYNEAAVFLHTSTREGWALTPMEAAACGAAVVATDSRGPSEYLTAGVSMTQVAPGDVDGLVQATHALLDDTGARVAQARAALDAVARFDWDASTDAFERLLVGGAP